MISFYKPTPKVTGTALSFYLNKRDNAFFSELLKQASWDASTRRANFLSNKKVEGKNVNIKFSQAEIASFIDAMERNVEFTGYHGSNQVVRFSFGPYIPKAKDEQGNWVEGTVQKGYSFRVTRESKEDSTNKAGFLIGLDYGEALLLKEHLKHLLQQSFEIADIRLEEKFKNNYKQQNTPQQQDSQPVEVEEDDLW
jgi:hypothetical protein